MCFLFSDQSAKCNLFLLSNIEKLWKSTTDIAEKIKYDHMWRINLLISDQKCATGRRDSGLSNMILYKIVTSLFWMVKSDWSVMKSIRYDYLVCRYLYFVRKFKTDFRHGMPDVVICIKSYQTIQTLEHLMRIYWFFLHK